MLERVLSREKEYLNEINKMKTSEQPIVLFGAGNTCHLNIDYLRRLGIYPVAFCDNAIAKIGTKVDDLDVLSLEQTMKKYPNAYYYITTQLAYSEIYQQLMECGVKECDISDYDIILQFEWEDSCINFYKENREKLQRFYEELADDLSRNVLENRLLFLQTRARKYATDIRERIQYFDKNIIDFEKIDTYADVGMYIGDTIESFIKMARGKYKEIIGFEPDGEIYAVAKQNLQAYENIEFINKGVSDFDGEIKVSKALGIMQTIETDLFAEGTEEDKGFEVCKLDTYLEEKKIDLLKMDIEGAELSALKGAENMLRKSNPILAICVYHKEEDIFTIPEYLKSIGGRYDIYMRHYSDNQTETVCYFVPKK